MKYLVIPANKVSLNNRLYTIDNLLEIKKQLDEKSHINGIFYGLEKNFDKDFQKYVGRYYNVQVNEEGLYLDFQLELVTNYGKVLLESRELFKPSIGICSKIELEDNIPKLSNIKVVGVLIQLVKSSEWYPYLKDYYNIKE